jgi:hypothetical protein
MVEWPTGRSNFTDERPHLGVVTVNWNTRDLLARMLYSVLRVVESGTITEVVVVDNASNDVSREVAQRLADEGIIRFIGNDTQRYQRLGGGLDDAKRLYEQGWSLARAAAHFDVSAGSVLDAFEGGCGDPSGWDRSVGVSCVSRPALRHTASRLSADALDVQRTFDDARICQAACSMPAGSIAVKMFARVRANRALVVSFSPSTATKGTIRWPNIA